MMLGFLLFTICLMPCILYLIRYTMSHYTLYRIPISRILPKGFPNLKLGAMLLLLPVYFCSKVFPQNIPDYSQRSLRVAVDSSRVQSTLPVSGDESVDPDEYIVGTGDRFFISISGLQDVAYDTQINQNGYLFIPKVGGVDLKNSTLNEAKEKITSAINKYFKDVDVFISLVGIRKITVSLLGDVKNPSAYVLPGNSRLIDLIGKSDGLLPTSNYRDIKIKSADRTSHAYDFLKYLRFSDKKDNPLLHEGDAVIVDKIDKTVSIKGDVIKVPEAS